MGTYSHEIKSCKKQRRKKKHCRLIEVQNDDESPVLWLKPFRYQPVMNHNLWCTKKFMTCKSTLWLAGNGKSRKSWQSWLWHWKRKVCSSKAKYSFGPIWLCYTGKVSTKRIELYFQRLAPTTSFKVNCKKAKHRGSEVLPHSGCQAMHFGQTVGF